MSEELVRMMKWAAGAVVVVWAAEAYDRSRFVSQVTDQYKLQAVRSDVDGAEYLVAHGIAAANCLARVRRMAWQVLQELQRRLQAGRVPSDVVSGTIRLGREVSSLGDIRVAELNDYTANLIAFNRNKGDMIMLCLTNDGAVQSDDVVLFVLLHELTHTMTSGYDPLVGGRTEHSDEFFRYEQWVYQVANEMGLVRPRDIQGHGMCGTKISHPKPDLLPPTK